ncbi:MAG TPA: hypothetical protein ENJ87_01100 [Gammaproteobacteria bacterium]|nr:hypothetical protein [Gammaproteobacteria bacterium]
MSIKDYSDSYDDCHKVWTARGLYGDGVEQNSVESIGTAFSEGAIGVEVDIFYDVEMQDFVVSHDRPYNRKNGKILLLADLFDAIGDDHYFWLDFKKIRHLTEEQVKASIERLYFISRKNNLQERVYIEGEAPINISRYRKAGFHTIFDTHPEPESTGLISTIMINAYKIVFYFGDHSVMGMEYGELDDPVFGKETRRRLKDIPVFLYHVPVDEGLVDDLLKIKNVRAFIVGNNQSVNYYDKDSCQ